MRTFMAVVQEAFTEFHFVKIETKRKVPVLTSKYNM